MNITQENVDGLNAVLKVKVVSEDYQPKVESALKNYQKKAAIPGFRPGKVPTNLIKKMYGKAVLIESINQLLQDTVINYIKEKDLDILGQPLPKNEDSDIDWENQQEFEFSYEMGLAPSFEVKISSDGMFVYETVKVDDELINKYVTDISKRYGKVQESEVSAEDDLLKGDFVEVNENGEIKEGGLLKTEASFFVSRIKDEATKKAFTGVKLEEKIVADAQKLTENTTDLGAMLGVSTEEAEKLNSKFQFTVKGITHFIPAEVNQEMFDKIYGEGVVTSEEEFRNKIKEELAGMFVNDSDRKLYNTIVDHLMATIQFDLPAEFLKRWITVSSSTSEKPLTLEQVEADFENYSKGIKWQLIENKIIKENNLSASAEELISFTTDLFKKQLGQYNPVAMNEDDLKQTAQRILQNQEEAQKIYNQLLGQKVMDLFKNKFTLETKEVAVDDFFKKA
jgi:trigger factor